LLVGFRVNFHVSDGDLYNEFSAPDILLGPGDLCSHVILVEGGKADAATPGKPESPDKFEGSFTEVGSMTEPEYPAVMSLLK
jgi:hypothetical protein